MSDLCLSQSLKSPTLIILQLYNRRSLLGFIVPMLIKSCGKWVYCRVSILISSASFIYFHKCDAINSSLTAEVQ